MPVQDRSFKNFVYSQSRDVNLSEAKARLNEFARKYNNGMIPDHLYCSRKAGINNIRMAV